MCAGVGENRGGQEARKGAGVLFWKIVLEGKQLRLASCCSCLSLGKPGQKEIPCFSIFIFKIFKGENFQHS